MDATTVAVDLAKDVFELAFADARGGIVERRRLGRAAFARAFENRKPLRVVMEACSSAHFWSRRLGRLGHQVRLLPAHDVRPYVRRNKTDRTDAAGLLEADRCAQLSSVPEKSAQQQGVQAQHRIREHLKSVRTATINLVRGTLREFGIVFGAGARHVRPAVLAALEDGDNELPMPLRQTLAEQLELISRLETQLAAIDSQLESFAREDPRSTRYQAAPGVGVITATALSASVGELSRFRSGRHFASWLGLTPREHSSGGQRRLGRMSKRGDSYLRMLLIHGARASLRSARIAQQRGAALSRLQAWTLSVYAARGHNKAAVALANKMARRLWAAEHHRRGFDPDWVSTRCTSNAGTASSH